MQHPASGQTILEKHAGGSSGTVERERQFIEGFVGGCVIEWGCVNFFRSIAISAWSTPGDRGAQQRIVQTSGQDGDRAYGWHLWNVRGKQARLGLGATVMAARRAGVSVQMPVYGATFAEHGPNDDFGLVEPLVKVCRATAVWCL